MVLLMMMMWWCWLSGDEVEGIFRRCASLSTLKEVQEKYNSGELFIGVCLKKQEPFYNIWGIVKLNDSDFIWMNTQGS